MANSKITGLPAAGALAGTEPLPVVQAAATKQSTISAILTYVTANISLAASAITSGALALARGGTGASLADPGGDRIVFWDDSAGAVDWLEAGSGLTIAGTTMTASGGYTQGARVYNSANISVSSGVDTVLTFDTETYDTDTMHSTVSNTGRLTCTTAGKYMIVGHVRWDTNSTSYRYIAVRLNGTTVIALEIVQPASASVPTEQCITTIYDLAATDYVELIANQGTGGALNALTASPRAPAFMAQRVG